MKIEATAEQIRALLQFAALDGGGPPSQRRSHEAVQRTLPRSLVERYHALVDAGRWPAVVAIERGICSGCHLRLPTAIESQTRRVPALHTCPSCRRILYVPELIAKAGQAAGGHEARPVATAAGPA